MSNISNEVIANFLEGNNPMKYVVAIETEYNSNIASVVTNDPKVGKVVNRYSYKSFAWVTADICNQMYKNSKGDFKKICDKFKVVIRKLKTTDENGFEPFRMKIGYKYMLQCDGSYNDLSKFVHTTGVDIKNDWRAHYLTPSPTEQFMIQTGIRLFKGFEEYSELHRMYFDIETTGLDPKTKRITQIGVSDNRGFEQIISVVGNTPAELRDSERDAMRLLGLIIQDRKPDIFAGYNSEDFDFSFIFERCYLLSMNPYEYFRGLNGSNYVRKKGRLKLGQDTFFYDQTYLWGINVMDVSHAVRKTMAINSELKSWGLKYITKYSKINKQNRVYVAGDIISSTWLETEPKYLFNDTNGDWFKPIDGDSETTLQALSEGYVFKSGRYIVERYLLDDLWETDKVDEKFNQASFLLSKLIPTSYMRSATMGTAGIWQLIMMAWSFENGLAVPMGQAQQSFTGGLSRLLEVGYAKRVIKLDYAALYPNTEITHDIFPEHDISGVMKGLLIYIAETRDIYKGMKGDYEKKAEAIKKQMVEGLSTTELAKLKEEYAEASRLASLYDMKQLPIKILANSFFGSFGAPHIFKWGDIDCAEETTCRGRQYLRLMVTHFTYKYGCRPLVCDTDGMNFAIPDEIDEVKYLCVGNHRFTKKHKGEVLTGINAVVAEFNDLYMIGRMGLDIDDICVSTINFSRKNYANHIIKKGEDKFKLVGNTIKSNKMPKYIEEFLDVGIKHLLANRGYEFIEHYYETVDKIVNYQIPLSKIASKAKVRTTYAGYEEKCRTLNKAGQPMPRQAHMELAIKHNLIINIGDTIYYINTGKTAKDGDIKAIKNKETKKIESVELKCKLLPIEDVENNPDATTDEYNAYKYLEMFNNRIKRLLVCFSPEIRDKIIITYVDNKEIFETVNGRKKYVKELQDRNFFTEEECQLCAGIPLAEKDQDDVELDLMLMEDREVEFWKRVGKTPNNMTDLYWQQFLIDYEERIKLTKVYNDFKSREMLANDLFNLTPTDFEKFEGLEYPEWLTKKYQVLPIFENDDIVDIGIYNKKGTLLTSFGNVFSYRDICYEIQAWKDKYKTKMTTAKWFTKFGSQVNINEYHLNLFGRSYDDDLATITYVPREYKDYDALYAEAEQEFVDHVSYEE